MKRIIIIVLTILTIVFYLSIGIAYNSSPSHPLFGILKKGFLNFEWVKTNPFVRFSITENNGNLLVSQISWSLLFFLFSSFLKNKFWLLISSILVISIWLKNYIVYSGVIVSEIYLKTSMFFLVSIFVVNFFNFIYKDKSVSNS